jgi:amino acid transporter
MTDIVPALKRTINLFHATMYGIGLILGAGIFVIIGDAAEIAGNLLWISFIISSFLFAILYIVLIKKSKTITIR